MPKKTVMRNTTYRFLSMRAMSNKTFTQKVSAHDREMPYLGKHGGYTRLARAALRADQAVSQWVRQKAAAGRSPLPLVGGFERLQRDAAAAICRTLIETFHLTDKDIR